MCVGVRVSHPTIMPVHLCDTTRMHVHACMLCERPQKYAVTAMSSYTQDRKLNDREGTHRQDGCGAAAVGQVQGLLCHAHVHAW